MTTAERLDKLTEAVETLRETVAVLTQRIEHTLELRALNGTLTTQRLDALDERCDERHDNLIERVTHLERSERRSYGWQNKLAGALAPAAVLVAIVSLLVSFMR